MSVKLSVVILARSGSGPVLHSLGALSTLPERPHLELIVANACGDKVAGEILGEHGDVTVVPVPAALTLAQQRDLAVRQTHGDIVAVLHERYAVRPGWAGAILAAHRDNCDVAAGSVDAAARLSRAAWGMYLYEYAHAMPPEAEGPVPFEEAVKLPGSNISYKRRVLELASMADSLWELDFHAKLFRQGTKFVRCSGMEAEFSYAFTLREYLSERFRVSYDFAALRAAALSPTRSLVAGLARAALPALVIGRIARQVVHKRKHRRRLIVALPWILFFTVVQACGETLGYWSLSRKTLPGVTAAGATQ